MIHEISTHELLTIKEALDLAIMEMRGIEECPPHEDYVLTTGADDACQNAAQLVEHYLVEADKHYLDFIDTD